MTLRGSTRHPVARGFDRVAAEYERGRPGYSVDAVRHLARVVGARRGRTVVELGSGTGKLTRQLLPYGAAIVAVEPSGAMCRIFERAVPGVLAVRGTAEAIPLPDGLADAVVAAQAFHWFRPRAALREIARVLAPAGTVALLWNVRDRRDRLVRHLDELVDRRAGPRPGRWRHWRAAFEPAGSGFGPLQFRRFPHVLLAEPEQVVEHALSTSRVALLPAGPRRALAAEIRALLESETGGRGERRVRLPTITELFWARRVGGRGQRRGVRRTRRTGATRGTGRTSPD